MPVSEEETAREAGATSQRAASAIYYFDVGVGVWVGDFGFKITSWREFWADGIGLKNRFLSLSMAMTASVFGKARIDSRLEGFPDQGDAGVATNDIKITKFGVTIYHLQEEYLLHSDGRQVQVRSHERFGPFPFLFNVQKEHPAEILDDGMRSIYYIPLLGTDWVAEYTVRADRNHIDSHMTCPWGKATEIINRSAH